MMQAMPGADQPDMLQQTEATSVGAPKRSYDAASQLGDAQEPVVDGSSEQTLADQPCSSPAGAILQ